MNPGSLLIRQGTALPVRTATADGSSNLGWTTFASGPQLVNLKESLTSAGWDCFYLNSVKRTVLGHGTDLTGLLAILSAKRRELDCNSLKSDSVLARSYFGIPYRTIAAHCCHVQHGKLFSGVPK